MFMFNPYVKYILCGIFIVGYVSQGAATPLYICTGANSRYYEHVLNLIGSIFKVNYDQVASIAVFDLGLTKKERRQLSKISKVTVHKVELTHPDLLRTFHTGESARYAQGLNVLGWFAWKPVVIKQALEKFPCVLWLDAGTTVLKPLDDLMSFIMHHGYFLATIGNEFENGKYRHPVEWGTTAFVKHAFNLLAPSQEWILDQEFVMGGIIGCSRAAKHLFIQPLYELSKDMRYWQDDGTAPEGYGCARHDQVLLSILAYSQGLYVCQQDFSQTHPIWLRIKNEARALHITWSKEHVSPQTTIYNSRSDLSNKAHYQQFIRYEKK